MPDLEECVVCTQRGERRVAVRTVEGLKLCEACAERGVRVVGADLGTAFEAVRQADDPAVRAEACAALARTCQELCDSLERSIANAESAKATAPVLPDHLERLANRADTAFVTARTAVKNLRDAAIAGSIMDADSRGDVQEEYDSASAAMKDLGARLGRLQRESQLHAERRPD